MEDTTLEGNWEVKLLKRILNYDKLIINTYNYGMLMASAEWGSENHSHYAAAEQSRIAAREARGMGDKELEIQAAKAAYQRFLTAAQYPPSFPQRRSSYLPPATREECLREALHTAQEFNIGETSELERIKNSLAELAGKK